MQDGPDQSRNGTARNSEALFSLTQCLLPLHSVVEIVSYLTCKRA